MVNLKIRCLICNKFEVIPVDDNNYLNWMISTNLNDLHLSDIDKILVKRKICNQCRIRSENE